MFSDEAIEDIKTNADNTHDEREWMCYVYERDGQYFLGFPNFGDESRIEVNPATKAVQDGAKGLTNRKWTIHGHPLKDGRIYTGRQYFSSTDICQEYCKSRDNNEYIVQFLVYPHQQKDSKTGENVFHNRVRVLIFPNAATVVEAMRVSNPGVDPMTITPQSGQNQNVSDGAGGSTLVNQSGVNWFDFQEALGKVGYMGIIDIEGPQANSRKFKSENLRVMNIGGAAVVALLMAGIIWINKTSSGKPVEIVDDIKDWFKY